MPLTYDKTAQRFTCSVHGEVSRWNVGWVQCWNGCDEGYFDGYEEDPQWYDAGDMIICDVCHGNGGWNVCGQCNCDNPDVEW